MCSILKGVYKGMKYISQILVKEPGFEIGDPTDVKHVAHIGADGIGSAAPPSWMNEFKSGPDLSANSRRSLKKSSSNGFNQPASKVDSATYPKEQRRRKSRSSISSQPTVPGTPRSMSMQHT